jgi:hypothetical protein
MNIVALGPASLSLELNRLLCPSYATFDSAPDVLELEYRLPYCEAVLIDLSDPKLIMEALPALQEAKLVIVMTNGNGDFASMQPVLQGLNCRFLQKPLSLGAWERAMDPRGTVALIVPQEKGKILVLEGNTEKLVELSEPPKRRGRPKKKIDA